MVHPKIVLLGKGNIKKYYLGFGVIHVVIFITCMDVKSWQVIYSHISLQNLNNIYYSFSEWQYAIF
jgi:hypothetical protein